MKKILLGTVAVLGLASTGALAQQVTTTSPFTVSIGGDFRHEFGWVDDDRPGSNDREMRFDYRFIVQASAKADNGLEYGVWFRIRNGGGGQPNGDGLRSDYKYIWLQGSWGRIELGDDDGAQDYTGRVYAPNVGIGQITDGTLSSTGAWGIRSGYYTGWGYQGITDDEYTKVMYITPKFAGFQGAVSYAPEYNNGNSIVRLDSATPWNNIWEAGLMYSGEFGPVSLSAGASYAHGDKKNISVSDDLEVWTAGAQLGYAGFSFGGGFFDNGSTDASFGTANVDDQWGWNLGLSYATGPWGIAAQYAFAKTEIKGGSDLEDHVWSVGGTYTLAPGLSLNADVYFFDNELGVKEDGTLAVLRTRVKF